MTLDAKLGDEDYCYLTTTGRVTGKPHEIEIWFALRDSTLYILSGGGDRSDWVKNARNQPAVKVRISRRRFDGTVRIVTAKREDALARRLLLEKYAPSYSGDLDDWGRTALPVAIDLSVD
jgi:deazaflavin-dependent oxidoreductase (nitroreductase family)